MSNNRLRLFVFRLVSVALVSMGFVQVAGAGMIGTGDYLDSRDREKAISELEVVVDREDVARQLLAFGADPDTVKDRIRHLTNEELFLLQDRIGEQVAGGDALGIIGAVFLVLLILELVGVTNIFTSL